MQHGCNHYNYEGVTGRLSQGIVSDDCPKEANEGAGDYANLTYTDDGKLAKVQIYAQGETGTESYYRAYQYDTVTGLIKRRYDRGTDTVRYKQFTHDAFERLTKLEQEQCTTMCPGWPPMPCICPAQTWSYNGLGEIVSTTKVLEVQNTIPTAYTFDSAARTKEVKDGAAGVTVTTTYVHDDFGRLIQVSSPDSGVTRFWYDEAGNLVDKRSGVRTIDQEHTSYSYDGANRLLSVTYGDFQDHCINMGIGQNIYYHYDAHADCPQDMCAKGIGRVVMVEVEVGCAAGGPDRQQPHGPLLSPGPGSRARRPSCSYAAHIIHLGD